MAYVEVADFENEQLLDTMTFNQILENIRALHSGKPRYFYQRGFGDGDYVISNGIPFQDIDSTNLACTLETTGNPVIISFRGAYSFSDTAGELRVEFEVDNLPLSNNTSAGIGSVGRDASATQFIFERVVELAAGEHTFEVQALKSGTGNLTILASSVIQFEVREL